MTTKAKICGIKTEAALDAAIDGGADYIGLVFFPKSPRHLDLATAAALAAKARGRVKVVALLVDPDDAHAIDVAAKVDPDIIQLHGHETPERVRALSALTNRPFLKAVSVATAEDALSAANYDGIADMILFDAKPPKGASLPGGNGLAFDWRALEPVKGRRDFMLSGGLTPDNVADAIRLTGAAAVDVSSGVETAPGQKSPELIRRFLRAVKTAKHH